MEKKKLIIIQIIVVVLSIILGTILHFLYEWTGENKIVAAFSAVNESVWEHLKLAFFPMLLFGIIEYFFVKDIANNYIEAEAIGIFVAISFIIVFFFTYTGIFGKNFLFIDILTFLVSIILGEYVSYKIMIMEQSSTIQAKILAGAILVYLLICFIVATYQPPKVKLFQDPVDQKYGIKQ